MYRAMNPWAQSEHLETNKRKKGYEMLEEDYQITLAEFAAKCGREDGDVEYVCPRAPCARSLNCSTVLCFHTIKIR